MPARIWFSCAKKPAHCGAAPDVPPTMYHVPFFTTYSPGVVSASSATSGTSRMPPGWRPQPDWNPGRANTALTPPPEPLQPVSAPYPAQPGADGVSPALQVGVVPPTPITCGELAGLSTLMMLLQSRLPSSPDAANHDSPMAFAFAKIASSMCWVAEASAASHAPQLVETTWPGSSVTIRLYITEKSASPVEAAM